MLSHEETIKMILLSQEGDENALATLIHHNTPLIKSIVKRYLGKNIEYDDLFQIASIGLLKAIKNFSTEYNVRFSTYAVPMILGEIKRQMRDDGFLKVSRSTKGLSIKINRYIEEQTMLGEKEPTIEQIAKYFDMSTADIVFAMDAAASELHEDNAGMYYFQGETEILRNERDNSCDEKNECGCEAETVEEEPAAEDDGMDVKKGRSIKNLRR